jgi:hypothetical protein
MTQPDYVPIATADRIRPIERLPVPQHWWPNRPADVADPRPPHGHKFGSTGPDLGYGLKLARRFEDKVVLTEGEKADDAIAGCFAVGAKRSSLFGRAPVIFDMQLAFTLWGFLPGAPADLVALRKPLFQGAAHHYWEQREIVDRVNEATFRLTPAQVAERLADWRSLLATEPC